jgi:hypothetical protein
MIPGRRHYQFIIECIQVLRREHPSDTELVVHLTPFWDQWRTRRRKDGQPYDRGNPSWLEWALNNHAPPRGSAEPKLPAHRYSPA